MENSQKHQRITETLLHHWRDWAGANDLPSEADIQPEALGEIWNHCFLVRVEGNDTYHYLYMGDAIIEAYGDDLTGHEVCARLVGELAEPLAMKFQNVEQTRRPVQDESSFMNRKHMEIRYRSCLLPLRSGAEDKVVYILGGMKWKAY